MVHWLYGCIVFHLCEQAEESEWKLCIFPRAPLPLGLLLLLSLSYQEDAGVLAVQGGGQVVAGAGGEGRQEPQGPDQGEGRQEPEEPDHLKGQGGEAAGKGEEWGEELPGSSGSVCEAWVWAGNISRGRRTGRR